MVHTLLSAVLLSPNVNFPNDAQTNFLMLLRWIHFLAGITWIGLLYFFNLVNVPFDERAGRANQGYSLPCADVTGAVVVPGNRCRHRVGWAGLLGVNCQLGCPQRWGNFRNSNGKLLFNLDSGLGNSLRAIASGQRHSR